MDLGLDPVAPYPSIKGVAFRSPAALPVEFTLRSGRGEGLFDQALLHICYRGHAIAWAYQEKTEAAPRLNQIVDQTVELDSDAT